MFYDVVVIGGGPIGSYTAFSLASQGFEVALLEEHLQEEKVICAGVIGKEAFERFSLPEEATLLSFSCINFHSPGGLVYTLSSSLPFALVVERGKFDSLLRKKAEKAGVNLYLGKKAMGIKEERGEVEVTLEREREKNKLRARVGIIATGRNHTLQKSIGMDAPPSFLWGTQVELPLSFNSSAVEIHFLERKKAPLSFVWIIPLKEKLRVGVLAPCPGGSLLKGFVLEKIKVERERKMEGRRISQGMVRRSVKGKVALVGECAGQVKTTTGGSLFYGFLSSEILTRRLEEGLRKGKIEKALELYDREWRDILGKEIRFGLTLRWVWKRFGDRGVDFLFRLLEKKFFSSLFERKIHFDFPSSLLKPF